MSQVAAAAAPWIALILTVGALVLAIAVLSARSLIVMSIALSAMAALAAGALLALNGGDVALDLVLAGAALTPILLLAGVLLSSRAAKPQTRGVVWLCFAAAMLAVAGFAAIAPELLSASAPPVSSVAHVTVWLAALMAAVGTAVAALLGYDERGVLEARGPST